MTIRLSTADRRKEQTEATIGPDGVPRYTRDNEDGRMIWDERDPAAGKDRRKAVIKRYVVNELLDNDDAGDDYMRAVHEIVAALRASREVSEEAIKRRITTADAYGDDCNSLDVFGLAGVLAELLQAARGR